LRQVFHLCHVGQKEHPGLKNTFRPAQNILDQPGAGRTPHPIEAEQKVLRMLNACQRPRAPAFFSRFHIPVFPVKKIFLVPRDNPGIDTGTEEFGLAEIRGKSLGTVEENLKDSRAAGATELEKPLPYSLSET
jgi:hypothetical protein